MRKFAVKLHPASLYLSQHAVATVIYYIYSTQDKIKARIALRFKH